MPDSHDPPCAGPCSPSACCSSGNCGAWPFGWGDAGVPDLAAVQLVQGTRAVSFVLQDVHAMAGGPPLAGCWTPVPGFPERSGQQAAGCAGPLSWSRNRGLRQLRDLAGSPLGGGVPWASVQARRCAGVKQQQAVWHCSAEVQPQPRSRQGKGSPCCCPAARVGGKGRPKVLARYAINVTQAQSLHWRE
jgi:hypothetical protein